MLSPRPRLHFERVDRAYTLVGSTAAQLRRVLGVLAPVRAGRHYGAYTDWTVSWSYAREPPHAGCALSDCVVTVQARVTLPRWRPPPNASPALVSDFELFLRALAAHESGHVALAREAGVAVCGALAGLHAEDAPALDRLAERVAQAALAAVRDREARYDRATEHGALQGAVPP